MRPPTLGHGRDSARPQHQIVGDQLVVVTGHPIDEHVEVALQAAGVGDIVGIEILNSRGWRP